MSKFKYQIPFIIRDADVKERVEKQILRYDISWNQFLNMATLEMVEKMERGKPISEQEV